MSRRHESHIGVSFATCIRHTISAIAADSRHTPLNSHADAEPRATPTADADIPDS